MGIVSELVVGHGQNVQQRILSEFNGHITNENIEAKSLDANYVLRAGSILGVDLAADSIGSRELTTLVDLTKPVVTSLPASPTDGEVIFLQADASNGIVWAFKYNASSSSSFKWEFIGGPPMSSLTVTDESTASGTYVNLTTTGPSVTPPSVSGDWLVSWGANMYCTTAVGLGLMSFAFGSSAATDNRYVSWQTADANSQQVNVAKTYLINTASGTVTAKYRSNGATFHFRDRWINVLPVRVG